MLPAHYKQARIGKQPGIDWAKVEESYLDLTTCSAVPWCVCASRRAGATRLSDGARALPAPQAGWGDQEPVAEVTQAVADASLDGPPSPSRSYPREGGGGGGAEPPMQRKRLQLQPRSEAGAAAAQASQSAKANPFGAAKPREEILASKGMNAADMDKQIERKAAPVRLTREQEEEIAAIQVRGCVRRARARGDGAPRGPSPNAKLSPANARLRVSCLGRRSSRTPSPS